MNHVCVGQIVRIKLKRPDKHFDGRIGIVQKRLQPDLFAVMFVAEWSEFDSSCLVPLVVDRTAPAVDDKIATNVESVGISRSFQDVLDAEEVLQQAEQKTRYLREQIQQIETAAYQQWLVAQNNFILQRFFAQIERVET